MFRRYSFFIVIIAILCGLAFWSDRVEHSYVSSQSFAASQPVGFTQSKSIPKSDLESPVRKELFEVLDRVISYEHYYRSIYGNFTQLLYRIGIAIPKKVAESYEIRVAAASKHRLLVTAFSEIDGRVTDLISVNQDYELISELPPPTPNSEYLQAQARKHLRALNQMGPKIASSENGLFRDYFKYESRQAQNGQPIYYAVGVKAPVEGIQIENEVSSLPVASSGGTAEADSLLSELLPEVFDEGNVFVGEQHSKLQMSSQEEARLAQRIFYGEMGRYAQSWSELSKITQFNFDEVEHLPAVGEHSIASVSQSKRSPASKKIRLNKSLSEAPTNGLGTSDLEIEAISSDR